MSFPCPSGFPFLPPFRWAAGSAAPTTSLPSCPFALWILARLSSPSLAPGSLRGRKHSYLIHSSRGNSLRHTCPRTFYFGTRHWGDTSLVNGQPQTRADCGRWGECGSKETIYRKCLVWEPVPGIQRVHIIHMPFRKEEGLRVNIV